MANLNIQTKILIDEMQQPVAVQIRYQDWLHIEQQLHWGTELQKQPLRSLNSFRASLPKVKISSVDLIRQMRDEGY
jgi:hypothetical protein